MILIFCFRSFCPFFQHGCALRPMVSASPVSTILFSARHSCAPLWETPYAERRFRYGKRSPIDRAASELALARTTASLLDPARPGHDAGHIPGLGQEMARVACVKPSLGM